MPPQDRPAQQEAGVQRQGYGVDVNSGQWRASSGSDVGGSDQSEYDNAIRHALLDAYGGTHPINHAEKKTAKIIEKQMLAIDAEKERFDQSLQTTVDITMASAKIGTSHDKAISALDNLPATSIPPVLAHINADLAHKHSNIRIAQAPDGKVWVGKIKDGRAVETSYGIFTHKQQSALDQ